MTSPLSEIQRLIQQVEELERYSYALDDEGLYPRAVAVLALSSGEWLKRSEVLTALRSTLGAAPEVIHGDLREVRRAEADDATVSTMRGMEQPAATDLVCAYAERDSGRPASAARTTSDGAHLVQATAEAPEAPEVAALSAAPAARQEEPQDDIPDVDARTCECCERPVGFDEIMHMTRDGVWLCDGCWADFTSRPQEQP